MLAAFVTNPACVCAQTGAAEASATIFIDASRVEGTISPMLYGQFDEFMFGGVKGGLTAELLRDRGFEDAPNASGLPRDWERDPDDRNDDPVMHFQWDAFVFYPTHHEFAAAPSDHSFSVDLAYDDGQLRGIHQGGLPIRQGATYRGYLWMKTKGFDGSVTVSLEADWTGGENYASAEVNAISGDWKKYDFVLTPAKSDPLARFVVLFHGRGHLWLDQLSLLPNDSPEGLRADVFQSVKNLRPTFIRWPGGNVAQDYHWAWGVGPRDQRFTWTNLSWGNEPEPGDFGSDEFIRFCRNVGAEPTITVNVEGRGATAEEAAAWVEYANASASSKYGLMRAANGNAEPFGVKYWEIGNEIWGDWVRAHSDASTYAQNYNRYVAAMLKVDPSLHFIAVGDNNMNWNRKVLKNAGAHIDYLAIHHYYGLKEMHGDALNLMARPLHYEKFYKQMREVIRELVPGRDIRLAINEWNTSLPVPRQHSMESALYAARLLNVFERSDIVAMSAVSDMVNGWPGGIIQASRHGLFVTPTYLVNELYSRHLGSQRIALNVISPTFDTTLEGKRIPFLDVVASRSGDGQELFIKAVNTDARHPLRTTIHLQGARVADHALLETVNGSSLGAANSFANPKAISLEQKTISAGSEFMVELPEHSVSVITLRIVP
jgi:alpha-L-arabinofuranosidase